MIQVTGIEEVINALQALSKKLSGTHIQQTMQTVGEIVRFDIEENFEQESTSFGVMWKKSHRAGKTLSDSGRLNSSFSINATVSQVEIGTNLEYAPIHHFGGIITAKTDKGLRFKVNGRFTKKQSVTIPARPYLPIDESGNLAPKTQEAILKKLQEIMTL
jgi:phage gpG-like protein